MNGIGWIQQSNFPSSWHQFYSHFNWCDDWKSIFNNWWFHEQYKLSENQTGIRHLENQVQIVSDFLIFCFLVSNGWESQIGSYLNYFCLLCLNIHCSTTLKIIDDIGSWCLFRPFESACLSYIMLSFIWLCLCVCLCQSLRLLHCPPLSMIVISLSLSISVF